MKLNKLAGLGIASIVLFGSVAESAVNPQSVQALEARQVATNKAELVNINFRNHRRRSFRHHGRRGFRRGFRHHGRRSFRHNLRHNSRYHGRRSFRHNDRQHLKFDKSFSTGNGFDEKIIRVKLF